jgi:hypothetical protein
MSWAHRSNAAWWHQIRWEILHRRAGGICEICDKEPATQLHHEVYPVSRREQMRDLIACCDSCHWRIHHPNEIMAANDNEPELPIPANDNEILEVRKRGVT